MIRIIAVLFGIAFIFVGVAGFIPSMFMDGLLFDVFEVNTMHNIVHLASGVLAIMAATSFYYTKLYFKIFGLIYTLVAILGFWHHDLLLMHMNTADNILHIVIGLIAIYLGFFFRTKSFS